MKFSEYLRKLDEGNLGHELEKQEAAKPKVGKNLKKVSDMTQSPGEQADDSAKRSDWRSSLRPTGDDGGAQAARDANNTVTDLDGDVMRDPKTGKPFPKTGPLKDWQIPSLRESERPGEAINYGRDEEEESSESTPVITNPAHPDYKANDPHNVRRRNNSKELAERKKQEEVQNRMKEREAREARLSDTIAHSEAKRKANESVEIPERDALGRLSIYSMHEASTPKPLRKALKKAKMGKKLSNKESGRVMRNTKADGSTRTNAAENYKNPQDDIDANDAAEADRRENAAGMDRQSHLDK